MQTQLPSWLSAFRDRLDAELVETHISWLLLAGDFAWKVKKPLQLPFLDYGSAERRRYFCEEEVRLNRRFAPALYIGVECIPGSEEHAVRMHRFDEAQRLDHLCRRGALTPLQIGELARVVASFQDGAALAGRDVSYGDPDQVLAPALDNFTALRAQFPNLATRLDRLQAWTRAEFALRCPALAARKSAGRVREGHGDLHLGNLVLIDGRVTAFDCIEFSEALRWIDVASELAFTWVDLIDHGKPGLAGWLLSEWLEATGDFEAVPVLRFYAVYRALVRAKVAGLGGDEDAAGEYLELAERLIAPPAPRLTIAFGLSGSGKSRATRELVLEDTAAATVRLRSDVERRRLFGIAPRAPSHSAAGEGIYSAEAGRQTYARLADIAAGLLASGWSVVVDAAFLQRTERDRFRDVASALGCGFSILAREAPLAVLRERIQRRRRDVSEATLEVLDRQVALVEPLGEDEIPFLARG